MIMFDRSIIVLTSFLLLFQGVQSACLLPTQLDGLCSSCIPSNILISGYCVKPMPGCQQQLSNNVCGTCMLGYKLAGTFCMPLTNSNGTNGSTPAQQNLVTYADHAPNFRYQLVDFYFKGKYSIELWDKLSNISMVFQLKTTYGYIYALTYMNPYSNTGSIYRAQATVDYFNTITEFRFLVISQSQLNDYSKLLWQLQRKVKVENIPTLNSIVLNQVQQITSNDYRLFYMSYSGNIYVKDIQRTSNVSSSNWVFPNLTQLSYTINQNTVINYVFSLFPNFQLHAAYTINFYSIINGGSQQQFYKFIFDSQIIVNVLVQGSKLSLYSYQQPDNIVGLAPGTIIGGYLPFINLDDATYLQTFQYVIQQYPYLSTKKVESVRYQVVQGTNFMIEFNNNPFSRDIYLAVVFKPLGVASPKIVSMYKNGVDITINAFGCGLAIPGAFNYQADTIFKNTYEYFRSKVQFEISSLLPIMSVQFVVQPQSVIDYMVIFTPSEYAFLRYDPQGLQKYKIISFTVFGTNISVGGGNPVNSKVSRQSLISFLQGAKPSLFTKTILIRYQVEVDISTNTYEVDILTEHGIYYTKIYQKGILYISTIIQISHMTCADISHQQYIANPVINSLNSFIFQNYSQLKGFSLSLVQGYVSAAGSISYRMLYSLKNDRWQLQIVESVGHYMINKLTQISGMGCSSSQVYLNGSCQNNCGNFIF